MLTVVSAEDDKPLMREAADNLRILYGTRIVPLDLLGWLNNGLTNWEHVVPESSRAEASSDPEGYRAKVVAMTVECLRKHCLIVDEHPTLSRMFTFRSCMEAMVLIDMLGLPAAIFISNAVLRLGAFILGGLPAFHFAPSPPLRRNKVGSKSKTTLMVFSNLAWNLKLAASLERCPTSGPETNVVVSWGVTLIGFRRCECKNAHQSGFRISISFSRRLHRRNICDALHWPSSYPAQSWT